MQNRNKLWGGWCACHRSMASQWHRALTLQVVENLPVGHRVFDGGNDPNGAITSRARLSLWHDFQSHVVGLLPDLGLVLDRIGAYLRRQTGAADVGSPG